MQRRLSIAIGGVVGLASVLTVALVTVPPLLRDKIAAVLDRQLDRAIHAEITVGQLDVSLLSSFPRARIHLGDLVVTGEGPFEGVQLARLPQVELAVDLWSMLAEDTVEIRRIALHSPRLDIRRNADGHTNLDLFPPSEEGAGEPAWTVHLDEVSITDLALTYDDPSADVTVTVTDLSTDTSGRVGPTGIRFDTASTFTLGLTRSGRAWLEDSRWDADVKLDYDQIDGRVTLLDNRITVNALSLQLDGTIHPQPGATALDLRLSTPDTAFGALWSLAPGAYVDAYDDLEIEGSLALTAAVVGEVGAGTWPGVDLAVTVADGRLRYPDLPVGVDAVAMDLAIVRSATDDRPTVVDLRRFALAVGDQSISGSMRLEDPLGIREVDLVARGGIDLDQLAQALPDPPPLSGRLDLDLRVAGRADDFLTAADRARASGTVRGSDLRYEGSAPTITVDDIDLTLAKDRADLRSLQLSWGTADAPSDLSATGHLAHPLPYLLGTAPLQGDLAVTSEGLDLRPFLGPRGSGGGDGGVLRVPTDLDLTVDARLATVTTHAVSLADARGSVAIAEGSVVFDRLAAETLGGEVELTGRYSAPSAGNADLDFRIGARGLSVADTMAQFDVLRSIAPVLSGIEGRFDGDLSLATHLDADGSADPSTVVSSGQITPRGVSLQPFVLTRAARQLGDPRFAQLELRDRGLAYRLADGLVELRPVAVRLGGIAASASGSFGVQGPLVIDLALKIPTADLQQAPALRPVRGDLPRRVDVRIAIRGTVGRPEVEVELPGLDVPDPRRWSEDSVERLAGVVIDDRGGKAARGAEAALIAALKQAQATRDEAKAAAAQLRRDAEARASTLEDAEAKALIAEANREADARMAEAEAEAKRQEQAAYAERDRLIQSALQAPR